MSAERVVKFGCAALAAMMALAMACASGRAQVTGKVPGKPDQSAQPAEPTQPGITSAGQKGSAKSPASTAPAAGKQGAQGGDSKSASSSNAERYASGNTSRLSPIAPTVPPARVFPRRRIGLALGGGGALGLTEVGVLQWFEDHQIPVDELAGTSMGCLVSSLYSTGLKPQQLSHIVNDRIFTQVFAFSGSYYSRSFRRREESRDLPNGITLGLKHRVSLRNAVLVDQGLNAFLDREFLRYDDQTDFNTLPIPLRCMATDLNDAKAVTFARGSIPDAVRASLSIPGIFPPFEMNGHEYVDGQVLENLPTRAVHEMNADVVLAVSLPLAPVAEGELGSILGVFGRSYSIATEQLEVQQRRNADLVIVPDIKGYGVGDYLKGTELVRRGYEAAEAHRAELLQYAIADADWQAYLAHRASLVRGPAAPVLRVRVSAPDASSTAAVQRLFAPLVNQPVDTLKIEALLDQVRSDGALDADYTVGYESPRQFAAHSLGVVPLPSGTIAVPVATTLSGQAPPPVNEPGSSGATPARDPGAPVAKPGTAPSSNQPGVPRSDGSGEPAQAAKLDEAPLAAKPGAPGLAATQDLSAESLSDIADRPIILVTVTRKKTGPPFLQVGANIESQTTAPTRATFEAVLLDQDFGGYGSELRSGLKLGYETELRTEYFRPLNPLGSPERTYFVLPRVDFLREPFPIFDSKQNHLAERQLQRLQTGVDAGWTNMRTEQLRVGYDFQHLHWNLSDGNDGQQQFSGNAQRVRGRYDYDTQDRALVPQYGTHLTAQAGYLFKAVNSADAPFLSAQVTYAHRFGLQRLPFGARAANPKDKPRQGIFLIAAEGGSLFDRNVAQPFRFTLGGPLRLSASAIDEYRGTEYFLIEPAILRRIAQLPAILGQSIYIGLGAAAGEVHAPGVPVIRRQDAFLGVVAETPLGVITLAPAVGSNGERKFVFTLGKIF